MSHISIKPGALTLPKFVKRLGYKSAQDREFNVLRKMLVDEDTVKDIMAALSNSKNEYERDEKGIRHV